MKKTSFLLHFIFFFASLPLFAQVEYEVIEAPRTEVIETKEEEREVYISDGTYVKYLGNRIIASGFHKKKVFEGVYKEFDANGKIETIRNYKNGLLDGEVINYFGVLTLKRYYTNDIQTGYETRTNSMGEEEFKAGPFFAGAKKEHVFLYKELFPFKQDQWIGKFDTIFLKSNKAPEIHRWYFLLSKGSVIDTLFHGVCSLKNAQLAEYTVGNIQLLLMDDVVYRTQDFEYLTFDRPKEVIIYEKNGFLRAKTFPSYRLEYYPNGKLKDSITAAEAGDYYHFRFDESGNELFKSKKEVFSEDEYGMNKKIRLTYDYLRNKQVFYRITSVNYIPKKVSSSNDSINDVIQKGAFTDYYGTTYITRPDGEIDTSYSKELFAIRYLKKLKPGRYYYLGTANAGSLEYLDVSESGNITVVRTSLTRLNALSYRDEMKIVFQKDSLYQLYDGINSTSTTRKVIWSKTGKLYSVDSKRNVLDYPNFTTIEQLIFESYKDSIHRFRSIMLTEKEYQAALKLKHISSISKKDFMGYMEELEAIRITERDFKKNYSSDEAKMIRLESRQLFELLYKKGFNPYFSESEFGKLMESYQLTKEEKSSVKRTLRNP
ncbi:toxin-antitoxin system YwqK family antitoxin [Fluviicola taffensis]|uniref:MORN variant repeat-containing protein n=1 Tax=Fluviicola taffensis (strain DSM 16823 / NCIMB 13979 / RW262) TaxID=755732 RepID=F2ICH9_FLUTR|nr:hypothetical protein [Fluviicola taffensis]AEA45449.1 hypothetical protein Fluta_3478 [Fluviicola taffensis DSM 16823]